MQSFIITSRNTIEAEEYAIKMCVDRDISPIDTTILRFEKEEGKTKNSIGIEEVRTIQQKLSFRPIHSKKKALIITDAHLLTTEAQNALLKVLEEPPSDTLILLTLSQKEALLPTICSRCSIVELNIKNSYTIEELEEIQKQLENIQSNGWVVAQNIAKNKEEALRWLEKAMYTEREKLLQHISQGKTAKTTFLQELHKAYRLLSTTNVNSRLLLENLFLQ
jgi:hypothetical protein